MLVLIIREMQVDLWAYIHKVEMKELCRLQLSASLVTTQKATTNKKNKNTPRYKHKTNNKKKEIKTQITPHVKLTKKKTYQY